MKWKWIGLDPSIAAFGYAVLERLDASARPRVAALGTMTTKPDDSTGVWEGRAVRCRELSTDLAALFAQHPDTGAVFIEQPVFAPANGKVAIHVAGRVRGIVEGICAARGLLLAEVPPKLLKLAVAGATNASKEAVAEVVRRYYGVDARSLDATDALAVAHVGAYRHSSGFKISSGTVRYNPPADVDAEGLD